MSKPAHSSDPRQVAAGVVKQVLAQDGFSNLVLSHALSKSNLSGPDKALCTELVYGTLRWKSALETSLRRALDKPNQKIDEAIWPHLLVAAYQLQYLSEKIPAYAAVNSAVNAVKRVRAYLGGFANAILRRIGSPLYLSLKTDQLDLKQWSEAFALPEFFVEALAQSLPKEELYAACLSMNERPSVWLRHLDEKSILNDEVKSHEFVPGAFSFLRSGLVSEQADFKEGRYFVQDPASQVAALLLAPSKGAFVVDCCAAPGSKSLILKYAVGEQGRVLAVDQTEAKIQRIQENFFRMGMRVETRVGDARSLGDDVSLQNKADAVLLDAPCSGLGTLRRHPEIKFKRTKESIQELVALQAELFRSAAACVKPGGVLVYSVCSPMPEEGREQVALFLQKHPEFVLERADATLPWLPADAVDGAGHVVLWPHRHECDAFFAARLRKR